MKKLLFCFLIVSCQQATKNNGAVTKKLPEKYSPEKGQELYNLNCKACHPRAFEMEKVMQSAGAMQLLEIINSPGHPTQFPSLDTIDIHCIKEFLAPSIGNQ